MEAPQQDKMEVEGGAALAVLEVEVAASALQGRRPYMEDRHTIIVDLFRHMLDNQKREAEERSKQGVEEKTDNETENQGNNTSNTNSSTETTEGKSEKGEQTEQMQTSPKTPRRVLTETDLPSERHSFFAVYDGHGGQLASTFASTYFHEHLVNSEHLPISPVKALEEACDVTDRLYADTHKLASSQDGTTACMILVVGRKLYAANVGDSRAVLCRKGEAVPLSFDHKPDKKEERQRIEEAGGIVKKGSFFNIPMGPFRVYQGDGIRGGLAVSRALGDTFYKDPTKPKDQWLVSGKPEILEVTLTPGEDEFFIVASDGFWDVFTNEGAVSKARQMLKEKGMTVEETASSLTELAFVRESLDNITVVVVAIKSDDDNKVTTESAGATTESLAAAGNNNTNNDNTTTPTQDSEKKETMDITNVNENTGDKGKAKEKENEQDKEQEKKPVAVEERTSEQPATVENGTGDAV